MTTNIIGEMAGRVDTIAVSESAKRQIGLQASEGIADSKGGPCFLEFSDVIGGPSEKWSV